MPYEYTFTVLIIIYEPRVKWHKFPNILLLKKNHLNDASGTKLVAPTKFFKNYSK